MDKKRIVKLLDEALDTAYSEGMEFVAETEGCTWSGKPYETLRDEALAARQNLLVALGLLTYDD